MVYIVGLGPGSTEYILPKAVQILKCCDIVLCFERVLLSLEFLNIEKKVVKDLNEILSFINQNPDKKISIAASGDPCFYGITGFINREYHKKVEVIPGLSSYQYLCARLGKPWQGCYLGSLHGREDKFLDRVREYDLSIWLTDKENSPQILCSKLYNETLDRRVYVGENLSYEDERIVEGNPEDLMNMMFSDLCVVMVEKKG